MGKLTLDQLSTRIKNAYAKEGNWRKTAALFGVTVGMAFRIAERGYEPKTPHIRHKLDLPALIPAPACAVCGEVHTRKTCPTRKPNGRRHTVISLGKLTDDERQAVMRLTPKERKAALLKAAKEK